MFTVRLLPLVLTEALAAVTVHWLLESAGPLPTADGPIHAVTA
jgi:hypothetical protein